MSKKTYFPFAKFIVKVLQGCLIGLGAVLPGISGGVLCVIFGIYKPIMEFLAAPAKKCRTHLPRLSPVIIGGVIGFLGIANVLSFFLEKYPTQSVCVFIGLIGGMLPSLFREAGQKGRNIKSFFSLAIALAGITLLLSGLTILHLAIQPNFVWYLFCGFCLALSLIAPGLSFSTLLMPLGLYEPFVSGIGHLDFGIILPGAAGALATIALLSKAIARLFKKHYSIAFHGIIGIVIGATIMIIPVDGFTHSLTSLLIHLACVIAGLAAALWLDKINQRTAATNKNLRPT